MRVVVIGAGAIGAYVGAALSRGGADVTLCARGEHLAAMREHGLRLCSGTEVGQQFIKCTDDLRTVGIVDVAVIALKAHQIHPVLDEILSVVGPSTHVVSMQNGIPWWYFQGVGGEFESWTLESVDPGGVLAATFPPERVIGCAIYCSTELSEPGVVKHIGGTRYSLGHPDGSTTETIEALAAAFIGGGLKAPIVSDLRREIWTKVVNNLAFNPATALTGATLGQLLTDAKTLELVRELVDEGERVAASLGIDVSVAFERRVDGALRVGEHKTSMLQDRERGRPFEIDCIAGAVVELGERLNISVVACRRLYALAKLLDRVLVEQNRAARVPVMQGVA
jgi:2-dehydropantoate 2-reductase